jgi:hypothetical protein
MMVPIYEEDEFTKAIYEKMDILKRLCILEATHDGRYTDARAMAKAGQLYAEASFPYLTMLAEYRAVQPVTKYKIEGCPEFMEDPEEIWRNVYGG